MTSARKFLSYSALCACTLPLLACQSAGRNTGNMESQQVGAQIVRAPLLNAAGENVGEAILAQGENALLLTVEARGQTPGLHGVHIHTVGKCSAPDFIDAGGHWNPATKQHGLQNPAGAHAGDLPNMTIAANGSGTLEMVLESASLNDGPSRLLDDDGAAFVIHAAADDEKTDPTGNSGARVACGIFVPE